MPAAARVSDACTPADPNAPGAVVIAGAPQVLIGGLPAARLGDAVVSAGPADLIVGGSATVLINGRPAARVGDRLAQGGVIASGCATVVIGG